LVSKAIPKVVSDFPFKIAASIPVEARTQKSFES